MIKKITALVFKVENQITIERAREITRLIENDCKSWLGEPTHEVVLSLQVDGKTRSYFPQGIIVPNDDEGIEDMLLEVDEIYSIKAHANFDHMTGPTRNRRVKMKVKKEGDFDPAKSRFGWDESKLPTRWKPYCSEEAWAEGDSFKKLFEGFPFSYNTDRENSNYIYDFVINRLEQDFPMIADANRLVKGKLKQSLVDLAKPSNFPLLPDKWVASFGGSFCKGTYPPNIEYRCSFITDAIKAIKVIEQKKLDNDDEAHDEKAVKANDAKLSNKDKYAIQDAVMLTLSRGENIRAGDMTRTSAVKMALKMGWKFEATKEDFRILAWEVKQVLKPGYVRTLDTDMSVSLCKKLAKAWNIKIETE